MMSEKFQHLKVFFGIIFLIHSLTITSLTRVKCFDAQVSFLTNNVFLGCYHIKYHSISCLILKSVQRLIDVQLVCVFNYNY